MRHATYNASPSAFQVLTQTLSRPSRRRPLKSTIRWLLWSLATGFGATLPNKALAQETPTEPNPFEEFEALTITTLSNRPQRLTDAAAAINVITQEDVRHSTANRLPELLRAIPGLNVGQINGYAWAIGSRSYQWQNASKLLVMIDGRSVYTPVYGGVLWDAQDTLLEDLDRIEVINGPGGSIWGANAFNGVINILTKPASQTQGTLLSIRTGTLDPAVLSLRHGWLTSGGTAARVYAKLSVMGDRDLTAGGNAHDALRTFQTGFRVDGGGNPHWTLQGDAYTGEHSTDLYLPSLSAAEGYLNHLDRKGTFSGANLKGLWATTSAANTEGNIQLWYDFNHRDDYLFHAAVHTADLSTKWTHHLGSTQKIDWGLSARLQADSFTEAWSTFSPGSSTELLYSAHIQDELTYAEGRLVLTAGLKLEHNESTGWEPQPNIRLLYHPSLNQSLWLACSRAVRTPTRYERNVSVDAKVYPPGVFSETLPLVVRVKGTEGLDSEKLHSFELGWRWQASGNLGFALTTFYYDYKSLFLVTTEDISYTQTPAPGLVLPSYFDNGLMGESYGGELAASWQPHSKLKVKGSVSVTRTQLHTLKADPFDYEQDELTTPRCQAALQLQYAPLRNFDVDFSIRYIDTLPYYHIPSYVSADLRLAWSPIDTVEIALAGKDLLSKGHEEYKASVVGRSTEIPRSVQLKLTWWH